MVVEKAFLTIPFLTGTSEFTLMNGKKCSKRLEILFNTGIKKIDFQKVEYKVMSSIRRVYLKFSLITKCYMFFFDHEML